MNPALDRLQPYPFKKLTDLKRGIQPPVDQPHIALSVGEPRHPAPALIREALINHLDGLAQYPVVRANKALRAVIAAWLRRRFDLPAQSLDPERCVLPVSGTREALFAIAQCIVDADGNAAVLLPNPFYQIYEGAALLAGARTVYLNCEAANGFLPDLDVVPPETWRRCQLLYLCTPGNPTGAIMDEPALRHALELAERYDFVIASDECYSEIYLDENRPPPSLLGAAARMGNTDYRRCLAFHSLSKRSNLPGLRSGFVAGDVRLIERFTRYRTYHGCTMPPPVQAASECAWRDEAHVAENRRLYREKFDAVLEVLAPMMDVQRPQGAFYLWPHLALDDQRFARGLFAEQNVTVLPGSFLSRQSGGRDPGRNRVRMALVALPGECMEAARRIRAYLEQLYR
jgi:N-succinyldiaminopimelate aminotransferase